MYIRYLGPGRNRFSLVILTFISSLSPLLIINFSFTIIGTIMCISMIAYLKIETGSIFFLRLLDWYKYHLEMLPTPFAYLINNNHILRSVLAELIRVIRTRSVLMKYLCSKREELSKTSGYIHFHIFPSYMQNTLI